MESLFTTLHNDKGLTDPSESLTKNIFISSLIRTKNTSLVFTQIKIKRGVPIRNFSTSSPVLFSNSSSVKSSPREILVGLKHELERCIGDNHSKNCFCSICSFCSFCSFCYKNKYNRVRSLSLAPRFHLWLGNPVCWGEENRILIYIEGNGLVRRDPTFYNYLILYHTTELNINHLLLHTSSSYNYHIINLELQIKLMKLFQFLLLLDAHKFSLLADNAYPIKTMPNPITHLNKVEVISKSSLFIEKNKDLIIQQFSSYPIKKKAPQPDLTLLGPESGAGDEVQKVFSVRNKLGNFRLNGNSSAYTSIQKRKFSTSSPLRAMTMLEFIRKNLKINKNCLQHFEEKPVKSAVDVAHINKLTKEITQMEQTLEKCEEYLDIVLPKIHVLGFFVEDLSELVYSLVTEAPDLFILIVISIISLDFEQLYTGLATLLPKLFNLLAKTAFVVIKRQNGKKNLVDSLKQEGGNSLKVLSPTPTLPPLGGSKGRGGECEVGQFKV